MVLLALVFLDDGASSESMQINLYHWSPYACMHACMRRRTLVALAKSTLPRSTTFLVFLSVRGGIMFLLYGLS